ncbi:MAG: T9SS type A sorting domain-containing protein [Sphingobacteriales bacterium]|nr:MAG: T9SS type A sorting domain-containing protein [Sphingobacteriales bacterium]
MKNITLLFTLLFVSLIVTAQKNVTLHINHKLGASAFAFNETAQNNLSQNFKISRVDYYISGIKIIHDGGMELALPDLYILAKGSASVAENLGSLNVTNVEGIKFSIGVEAPTNNEDPTLRPAGHPLYLQSPSMHWGWASGYRFVAMEGTAGNISSNAFEIHGLGNNNYFTQTVMAAGENSGNDIHIYLDADYTEALKDINVAAGPIDHGVDATDLQLLQNFRDHVFKPGSSATSVNNQSTAALFAKIYPNPVLDRLMIDLLVQNNHVKSLQVIDLLGKVHYTTVLPEQHNLINLSALAKGTYILKFYEGQNDMGSQKIILR